MDLDIFKNDIIICEDSYKNNILKNLSQNKKFLAIKFYNKNTFWQEYLFSYDEKAIYFLMEKYYLKASLAKMYLKKLYCIEDKEYQNEKLQFLKQIKEDLKKEHLLKYNSFFRNYLKDKKIAVIGYLTLEKWEEKIFHNLKATIVNDISKYSLKDVYEFQDMEEEVSFIAIKIVSLIKNGIDINKIKLMNVTDEYLNVLKRIFDFYKIPIELPKQNVLYGNVIMQKFLNNFTGDLEEDIANIEKEDQEVVNKIIKICNKYVSLENKKIIKELIIEDAKNTYIESKKLKNSVKIIAFTDYTGEDDYIFLLGFNAGVVPKYKKNEDYLTDNLTQEIDIYDTITYNKILKENTINKLKSIKNLTITYKLKSDKLNYFPSSLISLLDLQVKNVKLDIKNGYSYLYDKIKYASLLDDYLKYGNISEDYPIYQNSIKNLPYRTFNNEFKGLRKEELQEYLQNGLTLSYSSLNNYNRCAFRYYIANFLKLSPFSEKLETFIGSLCHEVLENCLHTNKDTDKVINEYLELKQDSFSLEDKFYLNKIIKDIKFIIKVLNKQSEYTDLDKEMHEKYIAINEKIDNIPYKFVGIIDKILYKELDDKTILSVIDYKTGSVDISLNYLKYGLSLQLPIYLYLIKKSNLFHHPLVAGFYLEHLLDKDIKRSNNYTYEEERINRLKLQGYSNSDLNILKYLDKTYENSALIKGLSLKNDGEFTKKSKVLSSAEMDEIVALVDDFVKKCAKGIINGEFPINPKKINYDKDFGCEYCEFQDVCFKKEKDYVTLLENRGEEYAEVD